MCRGPFWFGLSELAVGWWGLATQAGERGNGIVVVVHNEFPYEYARRRVRALRDHRWVSSLKNPSLAMTRHGGLWECSCVVTPLGYQFGDQSGLSLRIRPVEIAVATAPRSRVGCTY